jgi:NAD(P)-dependent dehydrogenase (short-subunit alcohol dehydrogenase family)
VPSVGPPPIRLQNDHSSAVRFPKRCSSVANDAQHLQRGRHGTALRRRETIGDRPTLVTQLGGIGVAVPVDHLDVQQVQALADQIGDQYGHVDVLVNDIWGAEKLKGGPADWNKPIWQHDLDKGLRILRLAIDTHLITSHYLLPLLIVRPGGQLVEVTDGTMEYNASRYALGLL